MSGSVKNDLTGQRFFRLTALRDVGRSKGKQVLWLCRCDCGNEVVRPAGSLRHKAAPSCGCGKSDHLRLAKTIHGHSKTLQYKAWSGMIGRCHNPTDFSYARYGGRGITVCEAWATSYEAFLADMGERPMGHSLDRIDNDKGYSPENCRWATAKQQANNRRVPSRRAA